MLDRLLFSESIRGKFARGCAISTPAMFLVTLVATGVLPNA
jgi:hypothetical protein